MRPHFIFNTLMSIYALCKADPEKAMQVIMDFNTYLQANFNAISNEEADEGVMITQGHRGRFFLTQYILGQEEPSPMTHIPSWQLS